MRGGSGVGYLTATDRQDRSQAVPSFDRDRRMLVDQFKSTGAQKQRIDRCAHPTENLE